MAFSRGAPAYLTCRASGVPEVEFSWFIQRKPNEDMQKIEEYEYAEHGETVEPTERVWDPRMRMDMYESFLVFDNVRTEHYYSLFKCEAKNKYGVATHEIEVCTPFLEGYLRRPSEIFDWPLRKIGTFPKCLPFLK